VLSADKPRRSGLAANRLLLVEDNRDALIAAAHLFESGGFVVDIARGALAGMVKAKALRPDIIVTDLMMPDVSGEEFVGQLRRRRATRWTPIIVYTAFTDARQLEPLLRLNVRVFAIKPCIPTFIAAEARQLLAVPGERDVRVFTGYGEPLDELQEQLSNLLPSRPDAGAPRYATSSSRFRT
jgi:CheY-like chemotaxis protein